MTGEVDFVAIEDYLGVDLSMQLSWLKFLTIRMVLSSRLTNGEFSWVTKKGVWFFFTQRPSAFIHPPGLEYILFAALAN